jgi:hypothetical protein
VSKCVYARRLLAEVRQEFFEKDPQSNIGYARARRRLRPVGLTSKMSSRPRRGTGRSSRWVATVASVSGGDQPEGARRGGKEAAEVACADRKEGASEDQAPEEDLARQVEARHACPAALRAAASSAARPEYAPGRAHEAVGKVSFRWGTELRKTIATTVSLFQRRGPHGDLHRVRNPDRCTAARQRLPSRHSPGPSSRQDGLRRAALRHHRLALR